MIPPLVFHAMETEKKLVVSVNARMEPMMMEKIILVRNAIILGILINLIMVLVLDKLGSTVVLERGHFVAESVIL